MPVGHFPATQRSFLSTGEGAARTCVAGSSAYTSESWQPLVKQASGLHRHDADVTGKEETPIIDLLTSTFSLPPSLAQRIAYAISHCSSLSEPSSSALERTRRYLKSIGRYGPAAFLVGQYGGAGEIAQGFCRYGPCSAHIVWSLSRYAPAQCGRALSRVEPEQSRGMADHVGHAR